MNGTHKILAALLLVQLGLGAVTWNSSGAAAATGKRKLLGGEVAAVTKLEIASKPSGEGEEAPKVVLEKQGENWVVASAEGYPAVSSKVDEALEKLVGLEVDRPIATQKANHNALRVGERDFDRRVIVTTGSTSKTLVLGSAKGTSVHVREGAASEVYWAKGLSTWNLSDRASSYVDTEFVKLDGPTSVTVKNPEGELVLVKDADGDWKVGGLAPEIALKQSDIQSFVDKAARVSLSKPVGKEEKPEYKLAEGATVTLEKSVEAKEGEEAPAPEKLVYRIGAEVDGKYYAHREGGDFVVEVSKWTVEKLLTQKADDFVKKEEAKS